MTVTIKGSWCCYRRYSTEYVKNPWVLFSLIRCFTCNDLSASTLAIFSSLNNSWKIQKLTTNNQEKNKRPGSHSHFVCAWLKKKNPHLPTWILAPLQRTTPGTVVRVVNSQAATSEYTPARLLSSVDFPTDGKPTNPIRASPVFATSKPKKKIGNGQMCI